MSNPQPEQERFEALAAARLVRLLSPGEWWELARLARAAGADDLADLAEEQLAAAPCNLPRPDAPGRSRP